MLDTLKAMLRNAREPGQRVDEAIFAIRARRRERREMRFLNWAEVETLASETLFAYAGLIRFACLTWLCQGELSALRASRVDMERQVIVVDAGARNGALVQTKTSAGRRQVKLTSVALAVVREQLLARPASELDLVFPTSLGAVCRSSSATTTSRPRSSTPITSRAPGRRISRTRR